MYKRAKSSMNFNGNNFRQLHKDLVARVLQGKGTASIKLRNDAFNNDMDTDLLKNLIDKIAVCSYKITDTDIDNIKASGFSEDQIFELIICAAVGQASRQYNNAISALTDAVNEKKGDGHAA